MPTRMDTATTADLLQALASSRRDDVASVLLSRYSDFIDKVIEQRFRREHGNGLDWNKIRSAVQKAFHRALLAAPPADEDHIRKLINIIVDRAVVDEARTRNRARASHEEYARSIQSGANSEPLPDAELIDRELLEKIVSTKEGKQKAIATAILLNNASTKEIHEAFGMSDRMARQYRKNLQKEVEKKKESDTTPSPEKKRASDQVVPVDAQPATRITLPNIDVEPDWWLSSPADRADTNTEGTLLLPNLRLQSRVASDISGDHWIANFRGRVLALRLCRFESFDRLCELELLTGADRYHPGFAHGWSPGIIQKQLILISDLPLTTLRDRKGLPAETLVPHLANVALALDSLAKRIPSTKLVHASVKPDTLFVFPCPHQHRVVRLGGFDQVRYIRSPDKHEAGPPIACPYAAPEAAAGWPSQRSDQYSLALTYCVLRGVDVVADGSGRFRPRLERLPEQERLAVARALSDSFSDRFASCDRFIRALRRATGVNGMPVLKKSDIDLAKAAYDEFCRELEAHLKLPADGKKFIAFGRRGEEAAAFLNVFNKINLVSCPMPFSAEHRAETVKARARR